MIVVLIISISIAYSSTKINLEENADLNSLYISIGNEYNIAQTIENGQVKLKIDEIDVKKYITAEIQIIYPDENIGFKFSCTKTDSKGSVETFTDNNGYALRKQQYIISIPYQRTDIIYFYMRITSKTQPYQYKLTLRNTEDYQCLNQCNFGVCSQKEKSCQCPSEQLDLDCSVVGVNLPINQRKNISSQFNHPVFLYYQPTDEVYLIKLSIEVLSSFPIDATFVEIYIMVENQQYGLPTYLYNNEQFTLSSLTTKKELIFDLSSLQYDDRLQRYPRILIALYSISISNPEFEVILEEYEPEDSASYLAIYIVIGATIAVFIIILSCCGCYKCKMRNQKREQNKNKTLNKQIIQQYMPSANYKEIVDQLKNQKIDVLPNEKCTVCLVDYQLISHCRVTPCQHIFHASCLDNWLQTTQNCPICREELTFEALKTKNREAQIKLITNS